MATIKSVFFFLTLSTSLGAYHARHLHDISIHEIFDRLPTFQAADVIQMVTGLGKPPRPPGAPPQGSEVTPMEELTEFLRSLPEAKPKPAPSQGQTTYGVDNTKSDSDTTSTEDLTEFLTLLPQAKPKPAPSQGQTTYGVENTMPNSDTASTEELVEFLTLLPQAKPKPAPSQGQTTYGVENTMANSDTTSTEDLADILVSKPTTSMDKMIYGRTDPSVQTPSKSGDPTHSTLSESLCSDGGSACTGLSTPSTYNDKIVYLMTISGSTPALSSY